MPQRDLSKSLCDGQEVRHKYKNHVIYGRFNLQKNSIIDSNDISYDNSSRFAREHMDSVNTGLNIKKKRQACGPREVQAKITDQEIVSDFKDHKISYVLENNNEYWVTLNEWEKYYQLKKKASSPVTQESDDTDLPLEELGDDTDLALEECDHTENNNIDTDSVSQTDGLASSSQERKPNENKITDDAKTDTTVKLFNAFKTLIYILNTISTLILVYAWMYGDLYTMYKCLNPRHPIELISNIDINSYKNDLIILNNLCLESLSNLLIQTGDALKTHMIEF